MRRGPTYELVRDAVGPPGPLEFLISSFSSTIESSVSAEMHGFYIYKKVAARDAGRIEVFSHLAIRRNREIFVQRQIRLTAGSLNFCPCLFDAPRGKCTFLLLGNLT